MIYKSIFVVCFIKINSRMMKVESWWIIDSFSIDNKMIYSIFKYYVKCIIQMQICKM